MRYIVEYEDGSELEYYADSETELTKEIEAFGSEIHGKPISHFEIGDGIQYCLHAGN